MSIRKTIILAVAAMLPCLGGLRLVASTLMQIQTLQQLNRLVGFAYLSFVDSFDAGGSKSDASNFFMGIGLLLFGSLLLTKSAHIERIARPVACALFLFLAFCFVYASLHPNIGIKPF